MEQFIPAVAMVAMVYKVIHFFKMVTNAQWANAATQIFVWLAGILVIILYAQTQWADSIILASIPLAKLNFWSLVAVGFAAGSTAAGGYDLKAALDQSDSAKQPSLFPKARQ